MLKRILIRLGESLMGRFKMKGIGMLITFIVLSTLCAGIVFISQKYYGPDNAIEEAAEEVIDSAIESAAGLPAGSIDIDLSKEDK